MFEPSKSAARAEVVEPLAAARIVAREIAELVRTKRASGTHAVLGLATGKTPIGVYRELVRLHREEGLSFAGVRTFNLDEYVGLEPADPRSFRAWMQREFFAHVDLDPRDAHVPNGLGDPAALETEARRYARAIADAGGIDYQLLGLGLDGHIAFNEPGSARDSRMRIVELAPSTRRAAAESFGGLEHVPTHGLSLGVADILEARSIRLLAFGGAKRAILERALSGPIGSDVPATFLREHADVRWLVDAAAAAQSR
ncbi:MAG: glucosamine-6-phosphate deaminase [Planctomycetes bacterium]|nr:glucosamine-6-phosphate deaminase [Planctomycetota bacterium]